ncbi:MAG TPA: hypothetical protein VJZ26_10045, partial [Blastocatellia bacterium]|nr:hypothetical protein [Blastocatellia bacterium]
LCFLSLLIANIVAVAQAPPSTDIEPGMSVERDFGPVTFVIYVDRKLAKVDIDVKLSGRSMAQYALMPKMNTASFDLLNGDVGLRGSLAANFAFPQGRSTLTGDFKVVTAPKETPFRGDVVSWRSPDPLIFERQITWLTPELYAQTDILFDTNQSVQVFFVTGAQVMRTITMSQGANDVVVNDGLTIGTVRIQPGMTLHLQPASPTQNGEVFLKGTFASSNLPEVKYSAAIATWAYIQAPKKGSDK